MAKAKIVTRKKGSKRGKVSAKPVRQAAAKRTTAKRAKSKVQRAGSSRTPIKKVRPPKTALIDEPVPGVVGVTEDAAI
jgi:hypothetical protein